MLGSVSYISFLFSLAHGFEYCVWTMTYYHGRERVKIFNESLSGMIKLFPTIPSRKRSRSDALSNERSSILYATDRSVSGTGLSKMGTQNQVSTNGFEVDQKPEERTKSVPNKRTRTSMVDPRVCSFTS